MNSFRRVLYSLSYWKKFFKYLFKYGLSTDLCLVLGSVRCAHGNYYALYIFPAILYINNNIMTTVYTA